MWLPTGSQLRPGRGTHNGNRQQRAEAASWKSHGWCACSASKGAYIAAALSRPASPERQRSCESSAPPTMPSLSPRHPLRDSITHTHLEHEDRRRLCLVASASAFVPQSVALAAARARSRPSRAGEPRPATRSRYPSCRARRSSTARSRATWASTRSTSRTTRRAEFAQAEIKHARLACCARRAGRSRSSCTRASPSRWRGAAARGGRPPPLGAQRRLLRQAERPHRARRAYRRGVGDRDAHGHEQARRLGRDGRQDRHPGEFNFDPIGLYGKTDAEKACARRRSRTAASR